MRPKIYPNYSYTPNPLLVNDCRELESIQRYLSCQRTLKIIECFKYYNPKNWMKYCTEFQKLKIKNEKAPTRKILYHLTSTINAKKILKHGFSLRNCKLMAFGKGVNLCSQFIDVLNFYNLYKDKNDLASVIVCEAIVGKAHQNSSDSETIVNNSDGSYFTKPLHMKPRKGFDSMFSKNPYKKIWIIPSSKRVFPLYQLNIKL